MTHNIKYKKPLFFLGSLLLFSFSLIGQNLQQNTAVVNDSVNLATKVDKKINLGFEIRKNSNVTGAVSTIEPDQFLKYDNTQWVRDALYGKITGLKFSDNIRGLGGAMIVIDGIPGRSIDLLNMEEIQEITILKDASAASLYGAMAKNGVIVVTTKRGSEKTEFNVSVSTGIKAPISMPNYLSSAEYLQIRGASNEEIEKYSNGKNPYRYTNIDFYSNDYFKSIASVSNVVADFSGSKDDTKYYINFGFRTDRSLQNVTENDKGSSRFNIRGNIDFRINDWITSSLDAVAIIDINKSSLTNLYNAGQNFRPNLYAPLLPIDLIDTTGNPDLQGILDAANKFDGFILGGSQFNSNPLASILAGGRQTDLSRVSQVNNSINFDLSAIAEGLSAKTYLSFDFYNRYNLSVRNDFATYKPTWNDENKIIGLENIGDPDLLGQNEKVSTNVFTIRYGFFGMLNYEKKFKENHNFKASLIGFSNSTFMRSVQQTDKNTNLALALNYNYKNKFLFDLNTSYIHSIKLAENNRGKIAPTLGFAYVMSEEESLKDVSWLNYLKIRSSAGIIYTDIEIPDYFLYDSFYEQNSGNYRWGDQFTSGAVNGFTKIRRGKNNTLGMEKRTDYNLGFEGLFFNKLWVEANVFRSDLTDRTIRASTVYPQYYNIFRPYSNFDAERRTGFEIGINYSDSVGDLTFDIGARVLHTDSKRTKVDEVYEDDYQYREGTAIDSYWGLKSLGFFGTEDFNTDGSLKDGIPVQEFGSVQPGDLKYKDVNNDGVVNDQDEVVIGRWDAPWTFGSDIKLRYKSFTLFTLLTAQTGSNAFKSGNYYQPQGDDKYSEVVRGRWTEATAATATFPRLTEGQSTNNFGRTSDFWMYDNSNFKVERVQLTYDLPKNWINSMQIQDFSVFVTGSNLLMIAKEKKIQQLKLNSGPSYRYFTLGARAKF